MKRVNHILLSVLGTFLVLGLFVPMARARVESELAPPEKRRLSVDKAVLIAKPTFATPLPAELQHPFAPPGFDLTDAEEAAAAAAAARLANARHPGRGGHSRAPDRPRTPRVDRIQDQPFRQHRLQRQTHAHVWEKIC